MNVRRLAKDNDIAVPARMDHLLRKALKFSLHVHKPDGLVPSLSDGDIVITSYSIHYTKLYDSEEVRHLPSRFRRSSWRKIKQTLFHSLT